jgi:hypothetical protein
MSVPPVLLSVGAGDDARAAGGALRSLPFESLWLDGRSVTPIETSDEWHWTPLASREWRGFTTTLEQDRTARRTILLRPPSGDPVRLHMPTRGGLNPRGRDSEAVESDVELAMRLRSWSRAAAAARSWNPSGDDPVATRMRRAATLLAAVSPLPRVDDAILTLTAPSPWTALAAEGFGSQHRKGMLLWRSDLLDAVTAALGFDPVAAVTGRSVTESRRDGPSETVLDVRLAPLSVVSTLPDPNPIESLRALEGVDCPPDVDLARWFTVSELGDDPAFGHEPRAVAYVD